MNLREQKGKKFRYFPQKASSKSIAKPRCCRSVVGNHRAASPCRISGKADLPFIQYPAIKKQLYPAIKRLKQNFPTPELDKLRAAFRFFFFFALHRFLVEK